MAGAPCVGLLVLGFLCWTPSIGLLVLGSLMLVQRVFIAPVSRFERRCFTVMLRRPEV